MSGCAGLKSISLAMRAAVCLHGGSLRGCSLTQRQPAQLFAYTAAARAAVCSHNDSLRGCSLTQRQLARLFAHTAAARAAVRSHSSSCGCSLTQQLVRLFAHTINAPTRDDLLRGRVVLHCMNHMSASPVLSFSAVLRAFCKSSCALARSSCSRQPHLSRAWFSCWAFAWRVRWAALRSTTASALLMRSGAFMACRRRTGTAAAAYARLCKLLVGLTLRPAACWYDCRTHAFA